jgi:hypothetical protein
MGEVRLPSMAAKRNAIVLALLANAHVAHAYRPFDSTDAAVADPGEIEIELGPVAYTDSPHASITEAPVLTVNAGLVNRWEAVLDASRAITRSANENDIETVETALLLKRVLRAGVLQEQTDWSVATEFGVLLPTVNADDDYGATLALIGSREVGRTLIHVNAGIAQNRDGRAELFGGLIIEAVASAPVRPVAELTFDYERGTDTRSAGALVGAIWQPGENLNFDMAVRAVREEHEWSYEGRVGLTWAFALVRR